MFNRLIKVNRSYIKKATIVTVEIYKPNIYPIIIPTCVFLQRPLLHACKFLCKRIRVQSELWTILHLFCGYTTISHLKWISYPSIVGNANPSEFLNHINSLKHLTQCKASVTFIVVITHPCFLTNTFTHTKNLQI